MNQVLIKQANLNIMKKVIVIGLFGAICLICAKFISAQATENNSLNPQVMRAIDEADSLNRIVTKQLTTAYTDTDGKVIRVRKLSEITDTTGLAKNIVRMVELETEAINAIQSLPDYVYVFAKYNYGCTTCGDNGLGEGSFFWPEMTSGEPVWPPVPLWVKNLNSRRGGTVFGYYAFL